MAQRVRCHAILKADFLSIVLDDKPNPLSGQRTASPVEEKGALPRVTQEKRARFLNIDLKRFACSFVKRDQALFVSLARTPHRPFFNINVLQRQRHDFRGAQSGGIHQLQQRAIPRFQRRPISIRRLDQALDILFRKRMGRRRPTRGWRSHSANSDEMTPSVKRKWKNERTEATLRAMVVG